jgi:uncharacterized protein (TIGR00369 family)
MPSRTVEWQPPGVPPPHLSGIEYLRAAIRGEYPPPPIARLLDFRLAEVGEGHAMFECTPGEQHYNPIGVVHGGLAATLLDSAMGCAVQSVLPPGIGYTTLEFKINFVRALTHKTGPMRARGSVIHGGRSTATAEGRLEDAAGKLLAHATTTCIILGR